MKTNPKTVSADDHIPASVIRLLDVMRDAVAEHKKTAMALLEATVGVYVECHRNQVRLTGVEIAKRTGTSPAYVSTVWKACDASHVKPRSLVSTARKLGYRQFTKKYSPVRADRLAGSRRRHPALRDITAEAILADIDRIGKEIKAVHGGFTEKERSDILFALLGAGEVLQHAKVKKAA